MSAARCCVQLSAFLILAACGSSSGGSPAPARKKTDPTDASTSDAMLDAGSPCDAVIVTSCPTTKPSFMNDVFPVLQSKCTTCHVASMNWPFDSYVHAQHWASQIRTDLEFCKMPPADAGDSALTMDERTAIVSWIVCGSPNN